MQAALLAAERLRIERGGELLVEDLSLSAAAGAVVHIRGRNGSGKTTLLRALAGLVTPDSGSVSWCGTPVESSASFDGELNFIGHQTALNGDLDAGENLRFLCALRDARPACSRDEALARFDAGWFADRPVRQLSAGQRQRVSLARLVLFEARVWMLDEPFTALDRDARGRLEGLIDAHAAAGGLTLIATHQGFALDSALEVVDLDGATR